MFLKEINPTFCLITGLTNLFLQVEEVFVCTSLPTVFLSLFQGVVKVEGS